MTFDNFIELLTMAFCTEHKSYIHTYNLFKRKIHVPVYQVVSNCSGWRYFEVELVKFQKIMPIKKI